MQAKYSPKTEFYAHQKQALLAGWNKSGFAFFMEMGTGKTKTLIDNFSLLYQRGMCEGALIISNKGSYANWVKREIPLHCPLEDARVHLWQGASTRHEQKALESLMVPDGKPRILVMNVEAFSAKKSKAFLIAERFLSTVKQPMMAVDESTTIKNPGAQRTKNVLELGRMAHWRRVMTGSPVTQSPLDLYSQLSFAVPGSLGTSFYSFRAKYAVIQRKNFGGREVPIIVGYQNLENLTEKIKPHMFRVTKDQCLDLPPKVYLSREVELTPEQEELYYRMKKNAYVVLEGQAEVSAMAVISQILRLHQIVCGHVVDDTGVLHSVPSNRVKDCLEVIDETSGSVIIWCNYRHDVSLVSDALEKQYGRGSVVRYDGSVPSAERENAINRFQGGDSRFFVGTVATGGYGITLTRANTVIYFSNSYDLERRVQSEDRAHRIGQTKSVTYVDLIAPGTVDEKIIQVLRQKMNMAATLIGDEWKKWLI